MSPIDDIGPDQLALEKLFNLAKSEEVKELILATNSTLEGETTAHYIYDYLKDLGAKELPPRTTELIGPRGMGVIKEELPIDQRRFDLPETYEKVSTSKTPIPEEGLQNYNQFIDLAVSSPSIARDVTIQSGLSVIDKKYPGVLPVLSAIENQLTYGIS